MRNRSVMLAAAALAALMLAPFGAQADPAEDNETNCLKTTGRLVIFSGADVEGNRRGLNLQEGGCATAGDPDLPYVDTNIITPGATHSFVGVLDVPSTSTPGAGTFTLGDTTVNLTWTYLNSRWESQSIALPATQGLVTVEVEGLGVVHYQKMH